MRRVFTHKCLRRHDTAREFCECCFQTDDVAGAGAFVLVSVCFPEPCVLVQPDAESAITDRVRLDRRGCRPGCRGRAGHYVLRLAVDFGTRPPRDSGGTTVVPPASQHGEERARDVVGDVGVRGRQLHRRPGRLLGGMGVNISNSRGFIDPSFRFREKYQLALGVVKSASEQAKIVCVNLTKTVNACAWVGFSLARVGKAS